MTDQDFKELQDKIQWHMAEESILQSQHVKETGRYFYATGPRDLPEEAFRGVHDYRTFARELEEIKESDRYQTFYSLQGGILDLAARYEEYADREEADLKKERHGTLMHT